MSERGTLILLSLGAVAAAYVLFAPKPAPVRDDFARPLSTEMRADGAGVAAEWLRASGLQVRAMRGRYSELEPEDEEGRSLASQGNVLVSHTPMKIAVRVWEQRLLAHWVERGNTLLLVAALADTPGWSAPGMSVSQPVSDIEELAGLNVGPSPKPLTADVESANTRLEQPLLTTLSATDGHPYFAGVREVRAYSDYPADGFRAHGQGDRLPWITLGRTAPDARAGEGVWIVPRGAGRIVVLAVGSAFTNRAIGQADNAAFLAALVTANLGARGIVWFDDAHQGATSIYNADALAKDPRLYETVALVLALWFAWVLGTQTLAARVPAPVPDDAQLITAAAGLLDRHVGETDAVRLMIDRFNRRHAPRGMSEAERDTYRWAAAAGPGAAGAAATLRDATEFLYAGKRVRVIPVRRAIVILEDLLK